MVLLFCAVHFVCLTSHARTKYSRQVIVTPALYVGHLESKERLRIQPAQLFHFS